MTANVRQIMVKGAKVGIMDLDEALEQVAQTHKNSTEQEIKTALLDKLEQKNYIPAHVQKDYAQAFYREFCKYLDIPVQEESGQGSGVKVLGPGCSRCDNMHNEVMEVLAKLGLAVEVEHITNPKEIASFGVMGTRQPWSWAARSSAWAVSRADRSWKSGCRNCRPSTGTTLCIILSCSISCSLEKS